MTCATRGAGVVGTSTSLSKHSKHHRQRDASQTGKSDFALTKPISLTDLQRARFIQTCVMWASTRLSSKHIVGGCGVNFQAPFTHPQIKPRALNTAPSLQIPSNKSPKTQLCGTLRNMHRYEALL
jgi:hypothetical protein